MCYRPSKTFPRLNTKVLESLRHRFKKSIDHLQRDVGNYLLEYVELFQEISSTRYLCKLFVWSSGNHHLARLKGAIEFIRTLDEQLPEFHLPKLWSGATVTLVSF